MKQAQNTVQAQEPTQGKGKGKWVRPADLPVLAGRFDNTGYNVEIIAGEGAGNVLLKIEQGILTLANFSEFHHSAELAEKIRPILPNGIALVRLTLPGVRLAKAPYVLVSNGQVYSLPAKITLAGVEAV